MPFAPPRPGGSDPESRFHQWVWDSIHALRPQDVPGMITHRTSRGTVSIPRAIQTKGGTGGGINWKGEWAAATSYKTNDLVRVSKTPKDKAGDSMNYTGIWLAVHASKGTQPIYPEADGAVWVMIAMGIRELNVADDATGAKRMLGSCNDPY